MATQRPTITKRTHDEINKLTVLEVISQLLECKDMTIREHESLPRISVKQARDGKNPHGPEREIAALPLVEVKRIMAMAHRYLVLTEKDKVVDPFERTRLGFI